MLDTRFSMAVGCLVFEFDTFICLGTKTRQRNLAVEVAFLVPQAALLSNVGTYLCRRQPARGKHVELLGTSEQATLCAPHSLYGIRSHARIQLPRRPSSTSTIPKGRDGIRISNTTCLGSSNYFISEPQACRCLCLHHPATRSSPLLPSSRLLRPRHGELPRHPYSSTPRPGVDRTSNQRAAPLQSLPAGTVSSPYFCGELAGLTQGATFPPSASASSEQTPSSLTPRKHPSTFSFIFSTVLEPPTQKGRWSSLPLSHPLRPVVSPHTGMCPRVVGVPTLGSLRPEASGLFWQLQHR